MTVGAINGVYQYTDSYIKRFFPADVSVARISDLMRQFGVLPTGDQYLDLQSLFQAMYNYYSINGVQQAQGATSAQKSTNAPWGDLMHKVGLTPTGILDQDYSAFMKRINNLEDKPITAPEKDNLEILVSQASSEFVKPAAQNIKQMSYYDVVAMVNKMALGLSPALG